MNFWQFADKADEIHDLIHDPVCKGLFVFFVVAIAIREIVIRIVKR
jgi:hypothetical protein